MIFEPFSAFVTSEYQIKFATQDWEFRGAQALRRKVDSTSASEPVMWTPAS